MNRFYAVALASGGIFLGACVAPQVGIRPSSADTTTKWEYKWVDEVSPQTMETEADMTTLGADRWELAGFVSKPGSDYYRYIFKRTVAN